MRCWFAFSSRRRRLAVFSFAFSLGGTGCATLPSIPGDRVLPIQEILEHSTCELQDAFRLLLQERYARFNANSWLVSISLLPKVDNQVVAGAGGTIRSTQQPVSAVKSLITWAIGPPGLQYDSKSQRNSGVTYSVKSRQLIEDESLICDKDTANYHALARHLGVGEWLTRTVDAMEGNKSVEVDKPAYNSTVVIRFAGNGSYTYGFLEGSGLLSLSGSYSVEQQLNITMTRLIIPRKFTVVSLPSGEEFGAKRRTKMSYEAVEVQSAKQRLDILQLEQAIRGLQDLPR